MSSNNLFKKERRHKSGHPYLKYVITISIAAILIVGAVSLVLFQKFDLDNIVDVSTTVADESTSELTDVSYSVNGLKGKSQLLIVITDKTGSFEFCSVIATDYDHKTMKVRSLNDAKYSKKYASGIDSLMALINKDYGYEISKYAVFGHNGLRNFLCESNSFAVDVIGDVNYHSEEFILELSEGPQELNGDNTYKYLLVSDNVVRSSVICDILNSFLTPDNVDSFDDYFKAFVNNSNTNISVIDFDAEADNLKVYSQAEDRFDPETEV
ncbi:MAG: hypothetical protein K5761_08170 [Clostridiales bacterium]|nr:hypothetical protein [Clostridiales bacterium]